MKKYIVFFINKIEVILSRQRITEFNREIDLRKIKNNFSDRTLQYKYFHHYFWNLAPSWLREHRNYFSKGKRGFGEDAFHAMWYLLFKEFKPKNILEIGVYRGQTLSLFSLLSKKLVFETEIHGISPFTSSGDEVSNYLANLNYFDDVIINLEYFELNQPRLNVGFSTDQEMIEIIKSKKWDLIYIDGNHDYEVAKQDFEICSKHLNPGGFIVLDDSSLDTEFKPPIYSTAGHPGPSRVASEINLDLFEEFLSVGHNRVFKKRN